MTPNPTSPSPAGRIIPGVSAIVPVAAREVLLKEAVESILAGSCLPGELIVVVDSSGEAAARDNEAARKVLNAAPARMFTRVIQAGGRGAAGARNLGAREARGDWLAFLDSDDLWAPKKLERQWDYLKRRPHLRACQTGERWWKSGRWLGQPARLRPRPGRFQKAAWRTCLVSLSSLMIESRTFFERGGFDESFPACEDFEFWLRYIRRDPIGLIPEGLVTKRSDDWPQLSANHSLDALRIRAILKTVRDIRLPVRQLVHARSACRDKIAILKQGARKRGQEDRFDDLEKEIAACFQSAMNSSRAGTGTGSGSGSGSGSG